jgi:hypothetical protein
MDRNDTPTEKPKAKTPSAASGQYDLLCHNLDILNLKILVNWLLIQIALPNDMLSSTRRAVKTQPFCFSCPKVRLKCKLQNKRSGPRLDR